MHPKQQAVKKNGCLVIGSQSESVHVHNTVWSKINTGCDFGVSKTVLPNLVNQELKNKVTNRHKKKDLFFSKT